MVQTMLMNLMKWVEENIIMDVSYLVLSFVIYQLYFQINWEWVNHASEAALIGKEFEVSFWMSEWVQVKLVASKKYIQPNYPLFCLLIRSLHMTLAESKPLALNEKCCNPLHELLLFLLWLSLWRIKASHSALTFQTDCSRKRHC